MTGLVLTIGHSNHSLEHFLALLGKHGVSAVADVRSMPYSRYNPQFNRETLSSSLTSAGLAYAYLGRELGGRSGDRRCYESGHIRYDRVATTASFRDGLRRLRLGMGEHRTALMCSEGDPLNCHRTLLVAHVLDAAGTAMAHILPNGELETHDQAMDRLLRRLEIAENDLFAAPRQALVELAIAEQAKRVGHAIVQDAPNTEP